jgi:hypothetical protein
MTMKKEPLKATEKSFTAKPAQPLKPESKQLLHPLLQMQQTIGNRAVLQLLQRKIAINTKDSLDDYLDAKGVIEYERDGNVYSQDGPSYIVPCKISCHMRQKLI